MRSDQACLLFSIFVLRKEEKHSFPLFFLFTATLPMQGTQVYALVGELRSHMLWDAVKIKKKKKKKRILGLPWWSSGWDSVLPWPGAQVWSLVWELRSQMPHGEKEKKDLEPKESRLRAALALLGPHSTSSLSAQRPPASRLLWATLYGSLFPV